MQQFQEAAERAYEPCREHFARQAELRKENQERREALIERLTVFAAEQLGENPNWRAINQAIVESRREWRQYAPVDQAIVKLLQARFNPLVDELQARLDAEYARNVKAKREFIARTAELLNLEDTSKAIDEAKNLQRTWRAVGIVPGTRKARSGTSSGGTATPSSSAAHRKRRRTLPPSKPTGAGDRPV